MTAIIHSNLYSWEDMIWKCQGRDHGNGERDLRDYEPERGIERAAGDNERASNEWIREQKNPEGACIAYNYVYTILFFASQGTTVLPAFGSSRDVQVACFVFVYKASEQKPSFPHVLIYTLFRAPNMHMRCPMGNTVITMHSVRLSSTAHEPETQNRWKVNTLAMYVSPMLFLRRNMPRRRSLLRHRMGFHRGHHLCLRRHRSSC
jgi:hypothetical protein